MIVLPGATNVTTYFALRLTADGKAAIGLTIANFDMQYVRSGVAPTAKVDAVALAATDTSHTDNRGIEIDATDQPGLYRFDWPDAAFAVGVREVLLSIKVATAFTEHIRVELDGHEDAIFDPVLTGSTHNITNSLGRLIRELGEAAVLRESTFQAGSTTTSLILDASASSIDEFYRHQQIVIIDGTAIGQTRIITSYNGTTKAAGIIPALVTSAPASGDEFQILTGGPMHTSTQDGGYANGQVYIDTAGGTAGTVDFVNGTITRPVDTIADAKTIADSLGLIAFHLVPGSSVTLAQTFNNYEFLGAGYSINLGSQDVGGCRFFNGAISGIGSGSSRVVLTSCIIPSAASFPTASFLRCNLSSTITLVSAANYTFFDCLDGTDNGTPVIDFGTAVGNTNVNLQGYFGRIQIEAMGDTGTDTLHLTGTAVFKEGTCTGGTVVICGIVALETITNLTIDSSSRLDSAQIGDLVWDEALSGHTTAGTAGKAVTDIEADTNELQGDWVNGGRLDLLLDAITPVGPTKAEMDTAHGLLATEAKQDVIDTEVDKVVVATITNAAGTDISADVADVPTVSEFEVRTPTAAQLAYIVENANTGLPVTFTTSGGSTTAAVLNLVDGSAGSAVDDQYNSRLLVFTDGTLKGVVTDITDYTGSTTTCVITAIPTAPTASHNARLI